MCVGERRVTKTFGTFGARTYQRAEDNMRFASTPVRPSSIRGELGGKELLSQIREHLVRRPRVKTRQRGMDKRSLVGAPRNVS